MYWLFILDQCINVYKVNVYTKILMYNCRIMSTGEAEWYKKKVNEK